MEGSLQLLDPTGTGRDPTGTGRIVGSLPEGVEISDSSRKPVPETVVANSVGLGVKTWTVGVGRKPVTEIDAATSVGLGVKTGTAG